MVEIYVSANSKPDGDGSSVRPFSSLEQARDAIRSRRKAGKISANVPITVLVKPGTYNLNSTFELTAEDSGTAQSPVTYLATEPKKVSLSGGVNLTSVSFTPITDKKVLERLDVSVRDKVRQCDLAKLVPGKIETLKNGYRGEPVGPWLYFDKKPMMLARWPNADAPDGEWATFAKAVDSGMAQPDAENPALRKSHPGSFIFDDPRPEHWDISKGVWLMGYWCHDWSDETIKIASYDKEKKIISLASPHNYGIATGTWGSSKRRFFALNLLEELDAPGEWYLDREKKILYFYPLAMKKNTSIVLATLAKPLLNLTNTKHVKLEGLTFEYCHSGAVVLHNTEGVEIAGCEVSNCSGSGIMVHGRQNVIRSCDLFNLGKSGIYLEGGDRKTLTPAGNLAVNNHIHHYGLFQRTYAPGIGVNGCGQIARNNLIHDAPHNAVLYGGNEHLFELNEIYRVVMETGDSGAFYTGRDWTSRGNVIRHNFIHDLGPGDTEHINTMGIYLDDCDCGDTIEGNIFYKANLAIMIGGGRDNLVLNNLVVDCPIGLHLDSRGTTWKQWNNPKDRSWCLEAKAIALNYTSPPWSEKYPKLASIMKEEPRQPLGNIIRRNIFVDCAKKVCDFDGNTKKILDRLDIAENLAVNINGSKNFVLANKIKGFKNLSGTESKPILLGFTDKQKENFKIKPDSLLLQEIPAFKSIPFGKIGLYKDKYRPILPNLDKQK